MKKTVGALVALLLILAIPIPTLAQAWTGEDFTLTPPEGAVQLSLYTPESDPAWALAGIGDVQSKLKEYQEMGVLVEFIGEEGSVSVMKKESSYSQRIFDLNLLTQEELDQVLVDVLQAGENSTLQLDKSWKQLAGRPFYRVKLDLPADEESRQEELHELIYGTIVNGYALNFHLFGGGSEVTPEQEAVVEELADSIKFTQILEKPEGGGDMAGTLALLAVLLAALIIPLIYVPLKSRSDKKKKAQLAQQLSDYHKTHGSNQAEGEPVFVNDTDCTKEAIHHFSVYQAYYKNIGQLAFSALMITAMLATAFLLTTTWWMRLIAAAVSAYYIYKLVSMGSAVERVQRKVYGRGLSQTAHYTFYPEAFRISGVQSASVMPYFQITDIRRKGQYIYLYYGPENAYMVDLYGFTLGEAAAFSEFIEEKVRKK